MSVADFVNKYKGSRKILLLIVYIALFLDNMLLTTVVPIIPEYLLRISHPNQTDLLLYNKVSIAGEVQVDKQSVRGKRETETYVWDDNQDWDVPMYGQEGSIPWENNPLAPKRKTKKPKNRGRNKSKTAKVRGDSTQMRPPGPQRYGSFKEAQADRHDILAEENVHVGLMFGSKALVQLIVNPFVGPFTNRIGYTVPMFTGFVIMFLSTVMFAFGSSYGTLWFARALQGVGSACTSTSGMGMLAQAYPDDLERGSAMGIALGGLALGVLVGPPYGGVLYQWSGKELPFILLALLALFDGSLQFLVLHPKIDRGEPEGSTIKQLAKDPYIIVAAGAITIGNLGIAMLEPSLPLWMMETWQAGSFERGAAFLPASISYLVGTNIFGPLAHRIGRWLSSFIGMVVIGFCLLAIPSATSVGGLIAPNLFMGFSIGMIDASMFPLMGHLVDLRHVGVYGSIYSIADAAFCFAFALGPFFSGPLVRSVGFPTYDVDLKSGKDSRFLAVVHPWMMYMIAIINFLYAPLMFFLRNPPAVERPEPIQTTVPVATNGNAVHNEHYEKIEGSDVTRMQGYQYEY